MVTRVTGFEVLSESKEREWERGLCYLLSSAREILTGETWVQKRILAESGRSHAATSRPAVRKRGLLWHWALVDRRAGSVFWSAHTCQFHKISKLHVTLSWLISLEKYAFKKAHSSMSKAKFPWEKGQWRGLETAGHRKRPYRATWGSNCKSAFRSVSVQKLLTRTRCFVPKLTHHFLRQWILRKKSVTLLLMFSNNPMNKTHQTVMVKYKEAHILAKPSQLGSPQTSLPSLLVFHSYRILCVNNCYTQGVSKM